MLPGRDDLAGRALERHIRRERFFDPVTGEEFASEERSEVMERLDGTLETVEHADVRLLDCNHPHRIGEGVSRCEVCSARADRPVYVCGHCGLVDPVTGVSACLRCTQAGPDGRQYTAEGLERAMKLGLFDRLQPSQARDPAARTRVNRNPRRSVLARLLEWW